jgi:hypothetical protein
VTVPRLLHVLAVACFIVALVCAAAPTVVFGVGWTVWTSAGLIAWSVEPLLAI